MNSEDNSIVAKGIGKVINYEYPYIVASLGTNSILYVFEIHYGDKSQLDWEYGSTKKRSFKKVEATQ